MPWDLLILVIQECGFDRLILANNTFQYGHVYANCPCTEQVWALYMEMYSCDRIAPVARWVVDIYEEPLAQAGVAAAGNAKSCCLG
jgi:hypothetical protein